MKAKNEKYIYPTKDGRFRVQIRPSKKIKNEFDETFDTKQEAIDQRDIFLAKQKLGMENNVNKNITFFELCDKYFEWFKNKPKKPSPNTLKDYAGRIRTLKKNFPNKKVYEITTDDIEDFLNKEKERDKVDPNHPNMKTNQKITSNTLHHEFVMLRILFKKAQYKWKIIADNPMDDVEEPKINIENEVEHIPYEEFEKTTDLIEKYASARDKSIFYLGLCGGLREEEVCGIHCISEDDPESEINFTTGKCFINQAVKQDFDTKQYYEYDLKSEHSERAVTLPEIAINSIKNYLKYRKQLVEMFKLKYGDEYKNLPNLFLNQYGDYFRPRYAGKLWRKFARKHNITVTFHGLRHTYITYQMNYNKDLTPKEVQELAGHADIHTTYKYVHKSEEKMKKAAKVFDNIFDNKIDINNDNTLCVPIMYVASIVTGHDYIDLTKLTDFLKYMNPNNEINYTNLSSVINNTKNYLLINYPSLETIIDLQKKYDKEDFEENLKKLYGKKYILEPIKDKDYTLS